MFNFFKKSKSKDNNSKLNNVSRNDKGKQTNSSFLTGSTKKNSTVHPKSSQQECSSSNEVCKDLNSSKISENVVSVKDGVMGNIESKSENSSPGLNKIGGNELLVERSVPPTVETAGAELFHLDKNSNGITEKADCSTSTSSSSPTVSDLLCGINSWEIASNERKKKESTPDSDVVFKTAPNTPILSRDNCPRQITAPAELPSIVEDIKLPQMETDMKQERNNQNFKKIIDEKKTENDRSTMEISSNKENREIYLETTEKNIRKPDGDTKKYGKKTENDKSTMEISRSEEKRELYLETTEKNIEKSLSDVKKYSNTNEKASENSSNSNQNITQDIMPVIDQPQTSMNNVETSSDSKRDYSVVDYRENVNIPVEQVTDFQNSISSNNVCNLELSCTIKTDPSPLNHDHSQESSKLLINEHSQESNNEHSQESNKVVINEHLQESNKVVIDEHSQESNKVVIDEHLQESNKMMINEHSQKNNKMVVNEHSQESNKVVIDEHSQESNKVVMDEHSQESNKVVINELSREQKTEISESVNDVQHELEINKDSETSNSGGEFSLETDSGSASTIDKSDQTLPNCDKLLELLSTDFPDNSKPMSESDANVCEEDDVESATNGGTSLRNVTDVEGLNFASGNGGISINDSCFDSSSDIEVSVCILMRKTGPAKVEEKLSREVGESIQSDGLTDATLSEGSRASEAEGSESAVEKICEVENLCPVAGNNNGCLAGMSESTSETKADPQTVGIENLPKIIIESVEEQDNGIVRLGENGMEEIYGDESSSDEDEDEDDSEEPLTVLERADFSLDNGKKSDDSGEEQQGASILGEAAGVRDTAAQIQEEMLDRTKEHLVNAEKRADKQMAELKSELEDSEKEMFRMRIQVQDLQRESIAKTGGMERLQAELTAAYKESEFVRRKLKRLEEELANFKQKNSDLTEELSKKAEIENENDYWKVMELENEAKELTRRVKELEAQLSATRTERDDLKKRVEELLAESEEERKVAQEALDEAMAEKLAMQEKNEREFEKLRSANIDREQKMLDDFEWKLREVEQACKKRLDDKEQSTRQQVREAEGKLTVAEGKLAQLPHLKQCEQELNHLRERSIEQQRSLRTATRQLEQLQDSDKQQHEEIQQLKQLLEKERTHLTTVQSIHYRELAEKDRKLQFKLDQQKTEINSEWEDKMKRETQRIKTESERHHRTEKFQALDEAKCQHQQKIKELESSWEKKHLACVKEIDSLKTKLYEKEDYYKQEFETIQTTADRNIFELRRKLDKIDLSYQEQIEKIEQQHEKELDKVREDADRRIQQCELNAQHQVGASRTTIELVKEQMQRESQEKLQQLSEHHRRQLEEQWEQLVQERDDAIAMIEQKHRSSMEKLRNELDSIYKGRNSRETELLDTLSHMRQELSGKTTQIGSLETNVEDLQGNLEVLNCEVNNKAQQISKVMKEGEEVLRQREQQLQETFHSQLEEMNERHRKEIGAWQNNVDELQKKIASLAKRDEDKDTCSAAKKIEELSKQLKEKEQQIATLSKEKHLYQLELMNKDKDSVQAKQRRKGGRGRHQGGRGQRC